LKIRDRTDLVAFSLAGDLNKIPPRALLFLELLLLNGRLLFQRKPVFNETRELVTFDDTHHVEVEVSTVSRGRLRMESQRTLQRDLLFETFGYITGMEPESRLLLNGAGNLTDHLSDGYPAIRQQVFKHPNRIAHHKTTL